jgi:hypothetical protein
MEVGFLHICFDVSLPKQSTFGFRYVQGVQLFHPDENRDPVSKFSLNPSIKRKDLRWIPACAEMGGWVQHQSKTEYLWETLPTKYLVVSRISWIIPGMIGLMDSCTFTSFSISTAVSTFAGTTIGGLLAMEGDWIPDQVGNDKNECNRKETLHYVQGVINQVGMVINTLLTNCNP